MDIDSLRARLGLAFTTTLVAKFLVTPSFFVEHKIDAVSYLSNSMVAVAGLIYMYGDHGNPSTPRILGFGGSLTRSLT